MSATPRTNAALAQVIADGGELAPEHQVLVNCARQLETELGWALFALRRLYDTNVGRSPESDLARARALTVLRAHDA